MSYLHLMKKIHRAKAFDGRFLPFFPLNQKPPGALEGGLGQDGDHHGGQTQRDRPGNLARR